MLCVYSAVHRAHQACIGHEVFRLQQKAIDIRAKGQPAQNVMEPRRKNSRVDSTAENELRHGKRYGRHHYGEELALIENGLRTTSWPNPCSFTSSLMCLPVPIKKNIVMLCASAIRNVEASAIVKCLANAPCPGTR